MSSEKNNLDVDVYWSMRSPYCYISLDRCLELRKRYHLNLHLHVVYPDAIKNPDMFKAMNALHYRLPYQDIDSFRSAFFHGVPMRYPDPDPVLQHAAEDSPYGKIAPFKEQIDAHMLIRTAVAATELGKGWEYLNEVMRLVWNGQKRPWNKDNYTHLRAAIDAAGIDANRLLEDVQENPDKYDQTAKDNSAKQITNDSKHEGVPNFIFRNEPFFGQDRMDMLIWRLKQYGLTERDEYEPSLRAQDIKHLESD